MAILNIVRYIIFLLIVPVALVCIGLAFTEKTTQASTPTTIQYQDHREIGGVTIWRMYDNATHTTIYLCNDANVTGGNCGIALQKDSQP